MNNEAGASSSVSIPMQYFNNNNSSPKYQINSNYNSNLNSNQNGINNFVNSIYTKSPILSKRPKTIAIFLIFIALIFLILLFNESIFNKNQDNYNFNGKRTRPGTSIEEFDFVVVADRDIYSRTKEKDEWNSLLKFGTLSRHKDGTYEVAWNSEKSLVGLYNEGGRGMELSELCYFNNKLLTFDDRTGIVYEVNLEKGKAIPKHILTDGDGLTSSKGFKAEWATVKEGKLYVGSIGKEWTSRKGEVLGYDPMYIKTIDKNGIIEHINWIDIYNLLRKKVGVDFPGYMVHEAVTWSKYHKKWFFLPRRVSRDPYDDEDEIVKGSNILISANSDFSEVKVTTIGNLTSTRGFSSFKFVPDHPNEIIALKSEEKENMMRTYIAVFDIITGEVLLDEEIIGHEKFEGVEFLPIQFK